MSHVYYRMVKKRVTSCPYFDLAYNKNSFRMDILPEDGGFPTKIGQHEIDNRWIVPYCPLLYKTFNAHMNVEFCNPVKSIKYVCKYVSKGSGAAMYALQDKTVHNRVPQYQMGRCISRNEAFWRIFGFAIHDRYPTVQHLAVHLENGQRVYFTADTTARQAQSPRETTMTAIFKLCQQDFFARTLLYNQVPSYYTWSSNQWNRRKRGKALGAFRALNMILLLKEFTLSTPANMSVSFYDYFFIKLWAPPH